MDIITKYSHSYIILCFANIKKILIKNPYYRFIFYTP
ncbi:MAG: hypothetical protein E7065_06910 [Lentimicrobiaceae bacterium]|nr:hypothetical protein [Lentimicrobiaceae bacterium]